MPNLNEIFIATRSAVDDLLVAGERAGDAWSRPRAPGKWAPSQVVEHVARALEESAHVVAGRPSKFPTLPAPLRPILRVLFFNRVLERQRFLKARTTKPMNPAAQSDLGPATPAQARMRLVAALELFERECQAAAGRGGRVSSTLFGQVSVEDYARFQELHTRHHRKQLPD